jgi:lysophospholipid acyltransferase (LPLAT)-like uncharacterized protein
MKRIRVFQSWVLAVVMLALRVTCRVAVYDDPRDGLRDSGATYAYSILHAHQLSAAINREKGTAAMVSMSGDGQLLLPGFWTMGIKAIRGSNRSGQQDKGGRSAIRELTAHVAGGLPAIIAVDGPRGPRNRVRKGIAVLSRESGAAVLNVVTIPTRRWILRGTWDRLQIPKPFSRIDAYFGEPLWPDETESVEQYRIRIQASLNELEETHDPVEFAGIPTDRGD